MLIINTNYIFYIYITKLDKIINHNNYYFFITKVDSYTYFDFSE